MPVSFNIITFLCSATLHITSGFFFSGFPPKLSNGFLFGPMCATCTAHLIRLDLNTFQSRPYVMVLMTSM
jgi:hypothetical protein